MSTWVPEKEYRANKRQDSSFQDASVMRQFSVAVRHNSEGGFNSLSSSLSHKVKVHTQLYAVIIIYLKNVLR